MKKALSILFLAVTNLTYGQNPLCFGQPGGFNQPGFGSFPIGIISADFNSDGYQDLVEVNMSSGNLTIRLGSSNGTFGMPTFYNSNSSPQQLCYGDFNGDSKLDIAVTNYSSNNISVFLGTGLGTFLSPVYYNVGVSPVHVATKDLNADSFLDLVVCCGNYSLSILYGSGSGTFLSPVSYLVGPTPRESVIADFNNDTYPDIVTANQGASNVSILFGSSTGTFSPMINYPVGNSSISPEGITTADFNNDGSPDIAVCGTNSVSILLGSTSGTFAPPLNFGSGSGSYDIEAADFNGDTKIDLAVANFGSSNVAILLGSGTGTFAAAKNFALPFGTYKLTANDFNSDGKIDLALTHGAYSLFGSVLFNSIPIPTITVNSGSICAFQSFTLNPTGALTYTFSGGSPVVTPIVNATYSVIGTNSAGCVSTLAAVSNVTVHSLPVLNLSGGSVCFGESYTLAPTGAQSYTYFGGGPVVSPTVTSSYSVTGTSAFGCIAPNIAACTLTVNPLPVFAISGNYTVCEGLPVTQIVNGSALTYSWSDGSTGNLVNLTPTVSTVYTVTGTDANNCSSSLTKSITVFAAPSLSVSASATSVCVNQPVTLAGSGASFYSWSDGVSDNTLFYPGVTKTYTVVGTDAIGCIGSKTIQIHVRPLPALVIDGIRALLCTGEDLDLSVSGADTYTWSTGETDSSVSFVPIITTTYSVTGKDLWGCINSATVEQIVDQCLEVKQAKSPVYPSLQVYPNPGSGVFSLKSQEEIFIKITNAIGQLVYEGKLLARENTIDLTSYPDGLYFIQYKRGSSVETVKLIKN